ncbi:hypothetical protein [Bifidobacterium longum]|nr:hypothetical protein [Bifidobacterium longum]CEE97704.1 Chromosome partition protein Smc [Bifidobacterium longum subsp. infantis]CEF00036.1 Chromosome partition protein Smc [Bifidobacterium longum subsp. infantis]CEF01033.1 Chromosome partition protein Smc [Bifidobacterium longum subsp. infantis]CEF05442.1 Chromosome partition protein Smc [Bifidobacterium longum subsp. infantis]CEF08091.1 Chromosome partition protein Smc [Bifidobacterium longum subsp. infantis]
MALHGEINPSDLDLLLGTGLNALEVATGLLTRRSGGVWIDTGDGSGILAGGNASDGVNRVDKNGVQLPLVDTSGIDKAAKDAQQKAIAAAAKADEAIAKGEQIRRDAQAGIDDVRKQAQDSAAKADGVRSDLESQTTALKSSISAVDAKANQVKAAADKISQRVDADKAALDKSIADVDAKAQAASDKGDKLAGQIGDVTTTVNGHTTKLDALSTRIEGVASDGQATTKSLTSLRQTVTGLSSTVSQSTKTASDAMSKATQVEQTANGISANLSKNYTSTAESNKKYAAKTELKTTAEGLQANITKSLQTADGAVTAASKAQATADGINATLSKDYQTAKDSDAKYSTKAELKATSNELSSSLSSVRQMADGAVTAASKAQQTADGISANLSKNYATKSDNDATYATQTSLKATSDSLAASINSNAKTAQGAVDKATNLEANLNGFKTTVADTYQSKGIGDEIVENGIPNPDRPNKFCLEIVDGVFQRTFPGKENHVDYGPSEILHQIGPHRTIRYAIDVRLVSGKDTVAEGDSINAIGTDVGWFAINVKLKDLVDGEWHSYEAYQDLGNAVVTRVYMSSYVGSEGAKVLQFRHVSVKDVTSEHKTYSTKSELTQTANSIKAEVTEVSQTATGAMSKVTTLEQTANGLSAKVGETARTLDATVQTVNQVKSTADSNKATISQVSTTANDALSRTPSLEQNLSGFKTEVSSTYATKSDLDNRPSGSNLWCNQLFDPDKPQITSLVDNVTAPNGSRVNLLAARDNFNPDTSFPVIPGRTYVITAYCKQIKGGLPLHAGIWYTHLTSGPAYEGFVKAESTTPLGDGWMAATWRFACPAGKSRGCVYFQIDNWPWDSGSTQWYVANVTCTDVTGLQPAGDYATNSSLMQTANQIRGEVSERYQSKNGMSSYATTSALTQKADEITGKVTEVAKTAQGNTTTISQVSQKVDRINTTLSQQIGGKADTSRVSSLEQNLDGFKSTVAATYQTKGDYPSKAEVQSRIDQSASSIKSTVGQTYTTLDATEALRKSATRTFTLGGASGKAKWVKLGYLTSNGDSSSVLLHVYSGDGFNGAARQNAEFEIFVKDGWQEHPSASHAFGVSVNRIRNADDVKVKVLAFDDRSCDIWAYLPWAWWSGHYALQGDYRSWNDGPNCSGERILDSEPTNGVAQNLAYDTLSTRSYVDQTSKSVALGVMQNYRGADGSGLATKSDITATANSITSTVSSTYATKSGVTQEISSKITQNNASLDVRFATKAENQTARDLANTAKSDASDARSRVGALEDCISLTSDGVQVGKRSNGVFTGPSALVGTDGAFHVKTHAADGAVEDVVKLGHDLLAIKSKLKLSDGSHLDRLTAGPYGDNHFALRMNTAGAVFNNHESVQIWQTGWQTITTGNGCEGYASYGYRGGCLRFRGRVKTTVNGDNSLFADPDLLDLATTPVNRNFLLPAYRNGKLEWTNTYVPANTKQVKIYGVWDWVSLDQLSIAQ